MITYASHRHTNCRAFINAQSVLLYFYCNAFFNYFYFDFSTSFFVDFVHFISIYILSDSPAGHRPAREEQERIGAGQGAGRQTWQTHKFTFVFGVCCNTKLIFYGCAHLCSIEGRARRRGDGGADRGSRDICNKHTLFIVYGVCICQIRSLCRAAFFQLLFLLQPFLQLFMHWTLFKPH